MSKDFEFVKEVVDNTDWELMRRNIKRINKILTNYSLPSREYWVDAVQNLVLFVQETLELGERLGFIEKEPDEEDEEEEHDLLIFHAVECPKHQNTINTQDCEGCEHYSDMSNEDVIRCTFKELAPVAYWIPVKSPGVILTSLGSITHLCPVCSNGVFQPLPNCPECGMKLEEYKRK